MPSKSARWLSAAALGFVAAVALGRVRLERATARRVRTLLADAGPPSKPTYGRDDVADLPEPVRRYFETVLRDGQPRVRSARLEQRGEFRLGDDADDWKSLTATQHYTTNPPGFVWDADIRMLPFLPVRVVDAYERGRGSLRAMALSTVPVATADPSPEMDEGELLRYLAEAVWFPTALLPGEGVEWEARDDRSARATLTDRGTTASVVFHFREDGRVERVSADERYRQADDGFERWTGHFDDYERREGMSVPTTASVEWNLPDGDAPYWRATVTGFDVRTR